MKVINEYLKGNMGCKQLAKKYNIPNKSTIQIWLNAYQSQGYDGLKVFRKNIEVTSVNKEKRIFHSDQGWEYQVKQYTSRLEEKSND